MKLHSIVLKHLRNYEKNFRFEQSLHIKMIRSLRISLEQLLNSGDINKLDYSNASREVFAYPSTHSSNLSTYFIIL